MLLLFHVHVYMCVRMWASMYVLICVQVYVETWSGYQEASWMVLHSIHQGNLPQLNLELADILSLSCQLAPGKLLPPSSQIRDEEATSQRVTDLLWQLTRWGLQHKVRTIVNHLWVIRSWTENAVLTENSRLTILAQFLSLSYLRKHNLTTIFQVLWLLWSFFSLFQDAPWVLGAGVVL